ncbi:MAG: hypothetical protein ACKVVP_11580, partial [Chloroflexota bacterium]
LDEGRAEGEARGRAEGEARGRVEGEARGRVEGRASEAREFLLLIATDKLGPPDPTTRAALERIVDVVELERLGRRLLQVGSWHELLTMP